MPTFDNDVPAKDAHASDWERVYKSWVRTPNWKILRKVDNLPVNPYRHLTETRHQDWFLGQWWTDALEGTGAIHYQFLPCYLWTAYQLDGFFTEDTLAADVAGKIEGAFNSALVKALVQAADAKTNLAVSVAEAGKTAKMIKDTATTVFKAYHAFRRGRLGDVAELLNLKRGTRHKSWLEYKYGWMPLLMDVKQSAEFFAQREVGRLPRFHVKAKETFAFERILEIPYAPYGSSTPTEVQSRSLIGTGEVRVKIWFEITNSNYSAAQQLGLTNPALVAWELVPFSFVFDWFVSVGDYLLALTSLDGIAVLRSMRSSTVSSVWEQSTTHTTVSDGRFTYQMGPTAARLRVRDYNRSSFVVDPLSVYPPMNDLKRPFEKLVTSLALLKGLRR